MGSSLAMVTFDCIVVDSTGISGARMAFYNCPALSQDGWAFFIPALTGYWMVLPIERGNNFRQDGFIQLKVIPKERNS